MVAVGRLRSSAAVQRKGSWAQASIQGLLRNEEDSFPQSPGRRVSRLTRLTVNMFTVGLAKEVSAENLK